MMRIEDYIHDARQVGATELLICSSQKIKMKVATVWKYLGSAEMKPAELREQIFQFISEEQKLTLLEEKVFQSYILMNKLKCDLSASIGENGFNLHIRWHNDLQRLTDFALPQSVIEVFRRGEGLSLVTGARASGKSTLAHELIEKVSASGISATALIVDDELGGDFVDTALFSSDLFIKNINLVRGFDFVVIDSTKVSAWRQAVQLAETGVRVLLILPFANIETALYRLSEKIEAQPSLGMNRIVHVLQVAIALKMAMSFDQKVQPVFELLFATAEIKQAMLKNQWQVIDEYVQVQGEKTGMRTMNQSILSLMLKRKIDLKSGFSVSPSPVELDKMLEKVGF